MAWSDAAREAAAAARKAHAGAKQQFSKVGKFGISADTSKEGRSDIARALKSMRRPSLMLSGKHSEFSLHEAVSNAAASTRLRNLRKKK